MPAQRVNRELQQDIEQFLYQEAWLLDERRLREWLDLLTDDAQYVMLLRERAQQRAGGAQTGTVQVLYEDDKHFLTLRVKRLETDLVAAERPASITRHLITNVQVEDDGGGELHVRSNFQVYQARLETDEYTFYGKREDTLRQVNGAWKIARRRTVLDHYLLPRTLTIFF